MQIAPEDKMGNKTGKSIMPRDTKTRPRSEGPQLSPRQRSRREDIIPRSLSFDSISTATTVNSQGCLLMNESGCRRRRDYDNLSLLHEEQQQGPPAARSNDHHHEVSFSSDEATVIINEDNSSIEDKVTENQQDLIEVEPTVTNSVMPDRILRKLTPEEWNELVQIFSHSLEQSLKSTLPKQNNDYTTSTPHPPVVDYYNHEGEEEGEEGEVINNDSLSIEERKKRSATVNCPVASKRHHRHQRRRRPVSLPPDTLLTTPSPLQQLHPKGGANNRRRRKHTTGDTMIHDQSHWATNHQSHHSNHPHHNRGHYRRKSCRSTKYITLAQLKDLGLDLKMRDGPLVLGTTHNNYYTLADNNITRSSSPPTRSLEQLCYLGPSVLADDEQDSSASNMAVADYDMCTSTSPVAAVSFPPTTCLKVKHLHQHKHRHIHVVHHTTTTSFKIEENYLLSTTEQ